MTFDPDAFMARLAGPPLVMGILNVTPDSFSDGGRYLSAEAAIDQAERMADEGADIIDIGAESTRPGHSPVAVETEWRRLEPVLTGIAGLDRPVSIDTSKAAVARRALQAGAHIVNDIWGLQRDPEMAPLAAGTGAPVICMHNRETVDPVIDIVADVLGFLERSLEIARRAGVRDDRIVLDPGFGFGKTAPQSLELLRRLDRLAELGFPLLIGLSRKRFIGHYSGEPQADARLQGTVAANLLAAISGHAAILRVHDVKPHRQALDFLAAFRAGGAR
ncbi:MAG: dihydropteroate synthase [Alphaproteobacteria bacterium]